MNAGWSIISSFFLVLIVFAVEYFCDDEPLRGPALRLGSFPSNVSNSKVFISNDQQWPALGERETRISSPRNLELNSNQKWPQVGERSQNTDRISNQNYNSNGDWHPSADNSFVQGEVKRWNLRLNATSSSVNSQRGGANFEPHYTNLKTTSRPFIGIQFESQNGNEKDISLDGKTGTSQVSDNELREFSEKLLLKDQNNAAKYVTVNFQGRTTSRSRNDEAPLPLLSINKEAYKIATIAKLMPLYDNYIVASDVNEDNTNQEKQEENNLLQALLETEVMKMTRNFLIEKGSISRDERVFKNILHDMWFHLYSRGKRKVGSSGFEHVFLAEIKNNDVSGLHNWIYFEQEEASHRANYLGFLKKIDLGDKGSILKFNFDFHGINKPVGSMFIGTSPEFEMALYSTCFILRADRICPLKLNDHRFIIRTYTYRYDGKKLIGSAFPEI